VNVVDSSGWLEYYADGTNASFFATPLENFEELVIPSITIYEVHKYARRQVAEHPVQIAVSQMEKAHVVPLDARLAKYSAELSQELGLPMADSIILATARTYDATLWTQDSDFKDIPGVQYRVKS
jgi:predicted nucleic acid-binding protein